MKLNKKINDLEKIFMKKNLPNIKIGDTVKIGVKIIEGNKERVQFYEGTIIAIKNSSINTTMTVRKNLQTIGIEKTFLIHSLKIDSINILRSFKIRRSKLYYLRSLKEKMSRLKAITDSRMKKLNETLKTDKKRLEYISLNFLNLCVII